VATVFSKVNRIDAEIFVYFPENNGDKIRVKLSLVL